MKAFTILLGAVLIASSLRVAAATKDPFVKRQPPPLVGRWDLRVRDGDLEYPLWLEMDLSGFRTLVGRYVGQFGSARPIANIEYDDAGNFQFVIPPQWEHRTNDIVFKGRFDGTMIHGETTNDDGKPISFEGRCAPLLQREKNPKWGKPIHLFNGRDLSGWKPRDPSKRHGWRVENGGLTNAVPGNDLVTEQTFTDFKLIAKFRYPKQSNSGIYLRGRYEVQIEDNFGKGTDSHYIGGVYGFLTPRVNVARPAGEWQKLEITLIGRVVTVVLNGEPIIERQTIPGITGGALDSNEEEPGPIMIQGDHGPIEFAELTLIPAK